MASGPMSLLPVKVAQDIILPSRLLKISFWLPCKGCTSMLHSEEWPVI